MKAMLIFALVCPIFSQTFEVALLGVSSGDSPSKVFETYNPLVHHLTRKVYSGMVKGGIKLRVYPSEQDLVKVLKEGNIHIARLKPQTYLMLQQELPELKLCVGEVLNNQFFREGFLIVQKRNAVRGFGDFKSYPFAFGPKMDPLLDIYTKALLNQKGLKFKDLQAKYLTDPEKVMHFVEVGRIRAGVVEAGALPQEELESRFRIFGKLKAPGMVWVMTDALFPSTRENVQAELLSLSERPLLNHLGIDYYTQISDHDLAEFKTALHQAIRFYK